MEYVYDFLALCILLLPIFVGCILVVCCLFNLFKEND